ncbi:MAG: CPBP family intramembrane metalloprotease [Reichenbachiella sp.]
MIFFNSVPAVGALFIHHFYYPDSKGIYRALVSTVVVVGCYSLTVGLVSIEPLKDLASTKFEVMFVRKTVPFATRIMVGLGILIVCSRIWKRESENFWGLFRFPYGLKMYLPLVLGLIVLLFFSSFSSSLHSFYPMYYIEEHPDIFGFSFYTSLLIYELLYLSHFVVVELIFRGLIPRVLFPSIGVGALYVSSALYFVIHFGKPLPETISSFFGGLLLCYIAQKTGSIWSGVLLHVTMAASMDGFSLLQRLVFKQ